MAYVGFDRTDGARSRRAIHALHGANQPLHLYGVAERRSRSVRFDIAYAAGIDVRHAHHGFYQLRLRFGAWGGIAARAPAMAHGGGPDNAVNVVPVGDGPFKRLDEDGPRAFTRRVAVSPGAEAAAASIGGRETALAEVNVLRGVEREVHSARHRNRTFAPQDRFAGELDRNERGGAHGVHGEARAGEIEKVRGAVRHGSEGRLGDDGGRRLGVPPPEEAVLAPHHSCKDPDPLPGQPVPAIARVFDHFPDGLEEEPLLRVHQFGFPRRNLKEKRVEAIHALQKASPSRVAGSGAPCRASLCIAPVVPTFGGDFGYAVPPALQVFPEFLEIFRHGVPTAHADNGQLHSPLQMPGRTAGRD